MMNAPVVVIRHVNKEAIKACHAGERFSKKFIGKYFPFSSYGASFAKISFSIPPYRNRFSYRRSVAYKQYMKLVTFLFSFPVPPCFKPLFPRLFPSPSFQSFPTSLKYVHKIKNDNLRPIFRDILLRSACRTSLYVCAKAPYFTKNHLLNMPIPLFVNTLSCTCYQTPKFLQGASLPSLLSPPFPFFLDDRRVFAKTTKSIFFCFRHLLSRFFFTFLIVFGNTKKAHSPESPENALVKALPLPFNRTRDFYFFSLSEK